jgi:hypothetical protein
LSWQSYHPLLCKKCSNKLERYESGRGKPCQTNPYGKKQRNPTEE